MKLQSKMQAGLHIPPKLAVINSFAGYGRCSMTEALPIISAMKVQACPVPTSIFSNHLGFPSHYGEDFTRQMAGYLAQWENLDLSFDGIYCGFLGNPRQVSIVLDFIRKQKEKGCPMALIDPVMGDHGRAFKTITPDHCLALRRLVQAADIITPNLTEACLLTDTPYREDGWQTDQLEALSVKLHAFGPKQVVITGLPAPENGFLNFVSYAGHLDAAADCRTNCPSYHFDAQVNPYAGPSRHGTGDIFAAILAADILRNRQAADMLQTKRSCLPSVEKAASFISTCIRASEALGIPECEGVCFENFLHLLTED